jgi:Na+-driven multidrug efflux pump
MYNISPETMVVGRQFMTVLAITMVGTCYQGTGLGGLVKAGGDTRFVFINDTIFIFLTVIPSTLLALFFFHAPAWVVFSCLKSDEITKCAVAVVKINRFNWMKNLTRQQKPAVTALSPD